tara:strand:+ start:762 stop:1124 length:363 start_codon:yes stop_codon:yes gene_type:complete
VKKEVIFYDGYAMGLPEDCPVELLENNKGKIGGRIVIKIPEYRILSFWDKVEQIGVWNWNKKYPIKKSKLEPILDGYGWELKLRDRNGRAKYCTGYESYPRKFKDLIKELNNLFGSDIRI